MNGQPATEKASKLRLCAHEVYRTEDVGATVLLQYVVSPPHEAKRHEAICLLECKKAAFMELLSHIARNASCHD